ncbi:MAG: hypothetical protein DYG96_02220 [Chlorobi bacterium CHB2]|nr:hypothetical protein [Chlorobi bacterium CHB2]
MRNILAGVGALLLLAPIALTAQSTGTIQGKVFEEEGTPATGASIRLLGSRYGAIANQSGEFRIINIDPGQYTLVATRSGSVPDTTAVEVLVDRTITLQIRLSTRSRGPVLVTERTNATPIFHGDPINRQILPAELIQDRPTQGVGGLLDGLAGVISTGNGPSIHGGRPQESAFLIDGANVSDEFTGGAGTSFALAPTPASVAYAQLDLLKSGFGAEYDLDGPGFNLVTRTGRNDRYEAVARFRTAVPWLYGWSNPLTVKKAGTTTDTTLPAAQLQGSGRSTYEFGVGGPMPGWNGMTFFISGKYEGIKNTSPSYKVNDMSAEYAAARAGLARQVWGHQVNPTNLGQLPHQQAMIRDVTARFKANLTPMTSIEFGGEIGWTSAEHGAWGNIYQFDHPLFVKTTGESDTLFSVLERDAQQTNENILLRRGNVKLVHFLDSLSLLRLNLTVVDREYELGEKDESRSYGMLDAFHIYRPNDANGDVILDRYDLPQQDHRPNPNTAVQASPYLRNPLTGLYEGPESGGASMNPYGMNSGIFPVHGNSGGYEYRASTKMALNAAYEGMFTIGEIGAEVKAGVDAARYTLRRHSNALPWDQNPFFDVYGISSNYFTFKDTTGKLNEFFASPYHPWELALYLGTSFRYKSIVVQPGVRFEVFNPGTYSAPAERSTFREVLRSLDQQGDAAMKFQVSPRIGIAYPITERSQFRVNFAMLFRRPEFNLLYDNAYGDAQRGNQLFGNPDIRPERQINYEMGYQSVIGDDYSIDLTAYYRDIFNQSGVRYVPALPSPYLIYDVNEFGNVRGMEVTIRRQLSSNFRGEVNYTAQKAVGTASSPAANYSTVVGAPDPYTGQARTAPLTEYPLSFDVAHKANLNVAFVWRKGEGPSIGGIFPLEGTTISLGASFATGIPYTLESSRGVQLSEMNARRFPSRFNTDAHIERTFRLADLFGESFGEMELRLFADINNLLNLTAASGVAISRNVGGSLFSISGNADADGRTLDLRIGDFVATPYHKDIDPARPETFDANQYDRFGHRLYNPYADVNLDGVVTQQERYEGYQRYVATAQSLRANYQQPRTVAVGFAVKF